MNIEQKINYQLNKYPIIKKYVKLLYQHLMYAISPKIKCEGNIVRISPNDKSNEYFFGYYDKSPWDITDKYMLCLKTTDTWSEVSPNQPAEILLIDTSREMNQEGRIKKLGETRAWNVQQGCMLQWLGPDYKSKIIYNDFRNNEFCSIILNIKDMSEKVISKPIYSVAEDGTFALTLDFTRLHSLRPGYGYFNLPEVTKDIALPDSTCIWKINLQTGKFHPLFKYTDFAIFQPREEMLKKETIHKVNHIMISPNSKRFMVLYRFFNGKRKYTRLITCNVDGSDMYLLNDDEMVSHCYWKNDNEIIAFENKHFSGTGYYLMKDKTKTYKRVAPNNTNDGHPSYSPNKKQIIIDSYPDRTRVSTLKLINDVDDEEKIIGRVFSPFKYDNDTRCDLHPRWNRAGNKICFDSVFEGKRGLYTVEVSK